jgi:hypothetical protein
MKLRSHLLVLIAATLLPMLVFAVIASVSFVRYQRDTFERGARDRTLALLTAVDAELRGSITTLQGLATISSLERDDLRAFHTDATRALTSQPDWLTINLALPSGRQAVNVLRPYGAELPMIQERPSFDRVLATREPAIGDLEVGALTKVYDYAVRVPVLKDGVPVYVLSAVVTPRAIEGLLAAQNLPADWVGVVLDRNARIVSRTVKPRETVGQLASESLRAALAQKPEGWFRGSTIEGSPVYTPSPARRSVAGPWPWASPRPRSARRHGGRSSPCSPAYSRQRLPHGSSRSGWRGA